MLVPRLCHLGHAQEFPPGGRNAAHKLALCLWGCQSHQRAVNFKNAWISWKIAIFLNNLYLVHYLRNKELMGIHIRIIVHNYKIFILQRIASHPFFFLANFFFLNKSIKTNAKSCLILWCYLWLWFFYSLKNFLIFCVEFVLLLNSQVSIISSSIHSCVY